MGSSLVHQATQENLNPSGATFRLRLLIEGATANLNASGQSVKLQFADKGGGTCASPGEAYADVTGATAISFLNNTTPTDGIILIANDDDPIDGGTVIVVQTYEEYEVTNAFTNSEGGINTTQAGKWDFALYDNGAPAATTYCFKVVKVNGSAPLGIYTVYPAIVTGSGGGGAAGGTGAGSGGGSPAGGGGAGGGQGGTENGSGGGAPTGGGTPEGGGEGSP